MFDRMQEVLISALRHRARDIRHRWERLLRAERVHTLLAHPDALMFFIPSSIEQVLGELRKPGRHSMSLKLARAIPRPRFACRHNPYVTYFKTGERALLEAFVIVQYELKDERRREADLARFYVVLRKLAAHETRSFCGVCAYRGVAKGCRFAHPAHPHS